MITFLFSIFLASAFVRFFAFSLRALWKLSGIVLAVTFLPLVLLVIAAGALTELALPVLAIVGLISLFKIGAKASNNACIDLNRGN